MHLNDKIALRVGGQEDFLSIIGPQPLH